MSKAKQTQICVSDKVYGYFSTFEAGGAIDEDGLMRQKEARETQFRATSVAALAPDAAYRPDIVFLRAIAVLSVIGFDTGVFSGGYIGVDIFFVIWLPYHAHDSCRRDRGSIFFRLILRTLGQKDYPGAVRHDSCYRGPCAFRAATCRTTCPLAEVQSLSSYLRRTFGFGTTPDISMLRRPRSRYSTHGEQFYLLFPCVIYLLTWYARQCEAIWLEV
jgi:hypothetical protein